MCAQVLAELGALKRMMLRNLEPPAGPTSSSAAPTASRGQQS
jgi:hypothetical protein